MPGDGLLNIFEQLQLDNFPPACPVHEQELLKVRSLLAARRRDAWGLGCG